MTDSDTFAVFEVPASELHDLRRRVLRGGDPDRSVTDSRDDDPTALHLGGRLGDRLVVAGSFFPSIAPVNGELSSYQLRYLATEFVKWRKVAREANIRME